METVHECDGTRARVSVIGIVDSFSAPELERDLGALVDGGVNELLLDLDRTEYLSSAGVRTFLRIGRRLEAGGGNLRFHRVGGIVLDVFRTTGIDHIFHLSD